MNKLFTENAWKDYLYWVENDKKILKRINDLIKEIERTPFSGMGKPEALRYSLQGFWSRRINQEHRLIYKIDDDKIVFIGFRFHYRKD